jgi:hypothetical protein
MVEEGFLRLSSGAGLERDNIAGGDGVHLTSVHQWSSIIRNAERILDTLHEFVDAHAVKRDVNQTAVAVNLHCDAAVFGWGSWSAHVIVCLLVVFVPMVESYHL